MPDPFLDTAELRRLTCRKTGPAQARMLDRMRIPYKLDGKNHPLVLRKQAFGDENQAAPQPNFAALRT